ncbi:MAG: tyrosine-type recombinase/integrase [Methylocystis sp.]
MPLTDLEIRTAKPGDRLVKLSDGGGLQLWITPDGAKRWRLAYRCEGAQKTLAVGVYPAVGLRDARAAREDAKKLLAAGQDPGHVRKLAKAVRAANAANTFDAIAAELIEKKRREGKADRTLVKFEWFMSLARPAIGGRPMRELSAPEILAALRPIEASGRVETAKKMRGAIGQVFRYAVATGRADSDPTGALKGAIAAPIVRHRAAIVEPKAFGALLRRIAAYEGAPETQVALEMLALTFTRPGELRAAEWADFDLEAGVWSIPAARMKMRREHRVPLAPRAIEMLRKLQAMTGGGTLLFPSIRVPDRCMSENTINAALRRLGFSKDEMCAHGFRSAASSMLNESGLWNPDAIERQLAHVDNDGVRRAYARADYWEERVRMMAWWAERCGEMKSGAKIIPLRA